MESLFVRWSHPSFMTKDIAILNPSFQHKKNWFAFAVEHHILPENVNKITTTIQWTAWIISLLTHLHKNPQNKNLSTYAQKMLHILEVENPFSADILDEINESQNDVYRISRHFPHIDPNIFLSKHENNKINVKLFVCIQIALHIFKFKHLKNAPHKIYYNYFVLFFSWISSKHEYGLPSYGQKGLPERKYFRAPENQPHPQNWLEEKIDPLIFRQKFADIYFLVEYQYVKERKGLATMSIKESQNFYSWLLYVNSIIPWGNAEMFDDNLLENKLFGYYWSVVHYILISSTICNGQRNIWIVPFELMKSEVLLFSENKKYTKGDVEEIIVHGKTNEMLSILQFLQKYDSDYISPSFFMKNDRSDINVCPPGIFRTTSIRSTYKKKIGKSSKKHTISQPCMLVCGHTMGDCDKGSKSPLKCENRMPFPCSFCAMLQCARYIHDKLKKDFQGNIENFNRILRLSQHESNQEHTDVSYLLKMCSDGQFASEAMQMNQNNQLYLPDFTAPYTLKRSDPGRWALKFIFNGSLILGGEKISIQDLIIKNMYAYPIIFEKWFPSSDCFYYYNDMKEKLKQKNNFIVGCYSTRSIATYMCQLFGLRPVVIRATFGWASKQNTLESNYCFHDDIREHHSWQVSLQRILYEFIMGRLTNTVCSENKLSRKKRKTTVMDPLKKCI